MTNIASILRAIARTEKAEKIYKALNFSIPFLIGLFVFLNPLPFSALSEICFYLSLFFLIILFFFRKTDFILRSPLTLPFVLFFIWSVFGLFFTLDFKNTFHDLHAHLLKYIIFFYLLVNYFNSQKRLEILSVIVIASSMLFSLAAVASFYFIDNHPFSTRLGLVSAGMSSNYLNFITIFGICLSLQFLSKSKNIFYKILPLSCFFIMTITTLMTQARGAMLGLLAALVILCFHNKKNIFFIIIVISAILLMPAKERITIDGFTKDTRIKMNHLTIEVIKDHPIAGIGFGMQIFGNKNLVPLAKYNSKLPPEYQQNGDIIGSPHNTILDIAVRTGVVGLILFLYILITSLRMLWRTLKLKQGEYFKSWAICLFACLVSYMIPALFADATFGAQVIVFYTMLAMITILWNIAGQSDSEHHSA